MKKRLSIVLCCFAALCCLPAFAGEWPSKPITIICPMPAGGPIDSLTRSVVVPALERELQARVIVKNVSGASGTTGTAEAAQARADGYTLLSTPLAPIVIQPFLRKLPYSGENFTPVYFIGESPLYLLTTKDAPYSTFQEFIDYVKARPDELAYGSAGPGSVPHLNMAALCKEYELQMTHIPDRGGAEVQKSMATGTVQVVCDSAIMITRFDNKPLIIFSDNRQDGYESVPSAKELNVPLRFSIWNAVWAPAGTPDEIIEKIHNALMTIADDPKAQEILKNSGAVPRTLPVEEFRQFVKDEIAQYGEIIKNIGL